LLTVPNGSHPNYPLLLSLVIVSLILYLITLIFYRFSGLSCFFLDQSLRLLPIIQEVSIMAMRLWHSYGTLCGILPPRVVMITLVSAQ